MGGSESVGIAILADPTAGRVGEVGTEQQKLFLCGPTQGFLPCLSGQGGIDVHAGSHEREHRLSRMVENVTGYQGPSTLGLDQNRNMSRSVPWCRQESYSWGDFEALRSYEGSLEKASIFNGNDGIRDHDGS